ncbi:MAG: GTPase Era [Candidatus Cloacimonetes bacterium]|nr:GTPase Era [Candidatus Cloacimonadota bacterium]
MNPEANEAFRSGFVAIAGRPNTGKSTFMNRVLGERLSITSPKPQTTRYAVKGILNTPSQQIIFVDTPGFLKPRYEMQERMLKIFSDALRDVDLLLFFTDIKDFPTQYDLQVLEHFSTLSCHQIAVFNKLDESPDVDRAALMETLPASIEESHFISSLTGENIPPLMEAINRYIPFHEPFYDQEQLSDLPMRFFATEVIREAIFHLYEQEIPYSTAVIIEAYREHPDEVIVEAQIWVEKGSQKVIIIGKKGEGLRKIREYSNQRLQEFLGMPVRVHLWVKVIPNWRKKRINLRELGFV